jgi:hypothetical protein
MQRNIVRSFDQGKGVECLENDRFIGLLIVINITDK